MPKKSKPGKEKKGSFSSKAYAQKPGREEEPVNASGSWKKSQKKGWPNGSKSKDGCLPKLFVLLMPFIAFGAYLFLR